MKIDIAFLKILLSERRKQYEMDVFLGNHSQAESIKLNTKVATIIEIATLLEQLEDSTRFGYHDE